MHHALPKHVTWANLDGKNARERLLCCILGPQHASWTYLHLEKCQIVRSGPCIFPIPSLFISESRVKLASLIAKRLRYANAPPNILHFQNHKESAAFLTHSKHARWGSRYLPWYLLSTFRLLRRLRPPTSTWTRLQVIFLRSVNPWLIYIYT